MTSTTRHAGLGTSTDIPDGDFETYSEAGYFWDDQKAKWAGPPGAAQNKKGLPVVGAAVYAQHPSTEPLCFAYDLKDGAGKRFWRPGLPPPADLFAHIRAGGLFEAHNVGFEWWIWNEVMVPRWGWPPLAIEQCRDSMAKARTHALPGALGDLSTVLDLQHKKDKRGKSLLDKFSMPRNPTKGDPRRRIRPIWDDAQADEVRAELIALGLTPRAADMLVAEDKADTQALAEYNIRDIEAEQEVSNQVPDLGDQELRVWITDQEINRRGIRVDTRTIDAAILIIGEAQEVYGQELQRLAGCGPSQLQQLKGWLHGRGVHLDAMDDDCIEAALKSPLPDDARRALEIRQAVGSASVKKVFAMRNAAARDDRLHDLYSFHGARTGRPTGNGAQPTNLPRSGPDCWECKSCGHHHNTPADDACPWCGARFDRTSKRGEWSPEAMEDAIEIVRCGSLSVLEHFYGDAMHALAGTLRGLFLAKEGHDYISSDFSAIEGVVIAALAGEKWRLDVFAGHGKIYEMSAAKITGIPFEEMMQYKKDTGKHHPARQMPGKVAELGLGFGGWVSAWKAFNGPGTDEEIKANILAWREASSAIVHFWGGQFERDEDGYRTPKLYGLEGRLIEALQNPGRWFEVERLDGSWTGISYLYWQDVLYCALPSGRYITYHEPRLTPAEQAWRGLSVSYMGWNTNPKNGPPGWIRMSLYGGRAAENVVQAVARDIQMNAIERLKAKGYQTVMHTYDEIVAEVPEGFGSVEELEAEMATLPEWARGWPIKASGGWRAKRYRKG